MSAFNSGSSYQLSGWRRRGLPLSRTVHSSTAIRTSHGPRIDRYCLVLLATFERVASYSALSKHASRAPPDKLSHALCFANFRFWRFFALQHTTAIRLQSPGVRIVIIPVDYLVFSRRDLLGFSFFFLLISRMIMLVEHDSQGVSAKYMCTLEFSTELADCWSLGFLILVSIESCLFVRALNSCSFGSLRLFTSSYRNLVQWTFICLVCTNYKFQLIILYWINFTIATCSVFNK